MPEPLILTGTATGDRNMLGQQSGDHVEQQVYFEFEPEGLMSAMMDMLILLALSTMLIGAENPRRTRSLD